MALMRRERLEFPDLLRRMFDWEPEAGWLRVEEFVDGKTLVVRAELPDIDPERDVELTVADGVLDVRAHREAKTEHKDDISYRSEFRYGSFERRIQLPEGTKPEDVSASYKHGVLEIRAPLPSSAKTEATKVPITRGS